MRKGNEKPWKISERIKRIFSYKLVLIGLIAFILILNLARAMSNEPQIINAKVNPLKVQPGDILITTVEFKDDYGIISAVASYEHENKDCILINLQKDCDTVTDEIPMSLIEGDKLEGTYKAAWVVHDTKIKKYYTTVYLTNKLGLTSMKKLEWWDPEVGHSASAILADTFDSGNFTFQDDLYINDKLGIGTTEPQQTLNVVGELNVTQGLNLSMYQSCTALETDASGNMLCGSDDGGSMDYTNIALTNNSNIFTENQTIEDSLNITNYLRVDNDTLFVNTHNNKVGIGTIDPESKLYVSGGDIGIDTGYSLYWDNENVALERTSGKLILRGYSGWDFYDTQGDETRIHITQTGNLGIGTTNPQQTLNVVGELNVTQGLNLSMYQSCTALETDASGNMLCGSDDGGSMDYTNLAMTNDTNTFTLNQTFSSDVWVSDRVGIGTTNPNNELHVIGQAQISEELGVGTAPLDWIALTFYKAKNVSDLQGFRAISGTVSDTTDHNNTHYTQGLYSGTYLDQEVGTRNAGYARGAYIFSLMRTNHTQKRQTGVFSQGGIYGPGGADVSGTIETLSLFEGGLINQNSGTINNAYGVLLDMGADLGTVDNSYAFYATDIYGTNQYGVYINDADAKSYFGGSVGIGADTTPDARLEITNTTGGSLMISSTASGDGDLFIVDDSGKVGIGTTNPQQELNVVGELNVTQGLNLSMYQSCTALETDASGNVLCGSDDGGSIDYTNIALENRTNYFTSLQHFGAGLNITGDVNITGDLNITGGVNLSSFTSCTALETDSEGNLVCGSDNGGSMDYTNLAMTNESNSFGNHDQTFDTDTLFLDSAGDKIGIGTIYPQQKLNVVGDLNVTKGLNLSMYQSCTALETDSAGNVLCGTDNMGAEEGTINSTAWNKTGTNVFLADPDDSVGIGTNTPGSKLTVYNGNLNVSNATGTTLFVDGDTGYVGIGTTSPQNELNVVGDGNFTGNLIVEGGDITGANSIAIDLGETDTDAVVITTDNVGDYDDPDLVINSGGEGNIRLGQADSDTGFQIYTDSETYPHALNIRTELNPDAADYELFTVQSSGAAERFSVIHGAAAGYASQFYDSLAVGAAGDNSPSVDHIDLGATNSGDLFVSDDVEIDGQVFADGAGDNYFAGNLQVDGTASITGVINADATSTAISADGDLVFTGSGDIIDFSDDAADKVHWYSNTYGTGIESSTLTDWSGSQFRWRVGGTTVSGGTERMLLDSSGNLQMDGDLTVGGGNINLPFGDNALESVDEWLRINDGSEHSAGVYMGTSVLGVGNTYIGGYDAATGEIDLLANGNINMVGTLTAADIECTNCIDTGDLKTVNTGLLSGTCVTRGDRFNLIMNDYTFFPNFGDNTGTTNGYLGFRSYNSITTDDTVGRLEMNCGDPLNYEIRWRYVTASRTPELFVWYDLENKVLRQVWHSEIEHPEVLPIEYNNIPKDTDGNPLWIPIQVTVFDKSLLEMDGAELRTNYTITRYEKPENLSSDDELLTKPKEEGAVLITHPEIYYGKLEYCSTCADSLLALENNSFKQENPEKPMATAEENQAVKILENQQKIQELEARLAALENMIEQSNGSVIIKVK